MKVQELCIFSPFSTVYKSLCKRFCYFFNEFKLLINFCFFCPYRDCLKTNFFGHISTFCKLLSQTCVKRLKQSKNVVYNPVLEFKFACISDPDSQKMSKSLQPSVQCSAPSPGRRFLHYLYLWAGSFRKTLVSYTLSMELRPYWPASLPRLAMVNVYIKRPALVCTTSWWCRGPGSIACAFMLSSQRQKDRKHK